MRHLLFIRDTPANKITYYHLVLFVLVLPFDRVYSELVLISLFLHTLINLDATKLRSLRSGKMLIPAAIYLLNCFGTIYTRYRGQAFFEWEIQLALILFPFIFSVTSLDIKKYAINLLTLFGLSCVATVIYLYYNAFSVMMYHHLPVAAIFSPAFINHNFSLPIDLHATYFSLYILLSITVFIQLWVKSGKIQHRLVYSICLLILLASMIQLSSRSVLISLVVIINSIVPFLLFKKSLRFRFIIASLLISGLFILLFTRIDTFNTRYISDLKGDLTQASFNNNLPEPRALRWQCAVELIKASPVLGHGSGSEIALLKESYFRHHFYNSYVNELNAHNQYLSIWIKTGIVGLIIFLWVLYKGFSAAMQNRDMLFCGFMIMISVTAFAENIMDVNKGIFFFAFFFSLFYLGKVKEAKVI